jgi:hypothetical protein
MAAWEKDIATSDELHVLRQEYSSAGGVNECVILPHRYPLSLVGDLTPEHETLCELVRLFPDGVVMGMKEAHTAISESEEATALLNVDPQGRALVAVAALSYVRWANLVLHWQSRRTGTMSDAYNAVLVIRAVVPYMLEREFSANADVASDLVTGSAWLSSKLGALKFQRVVTFLEKQFGPSGVAAHESLRAAIARAGTNLRTDAINPSTLGMKGEATRVGGTTLGQLLDRMDALTGVKTRADPNFKPFGPRTK